MQISIDTKHDSPEEIKKAIRMLQSLVNDRSVYTNSGSSRNIFENSEPTVTPGSSSEPGNVFGNLFGDDNNSPSATTTTEEKEDKPPQIIPYNY